MRGSDRSRRAPRALEPVPSVPTLAVADAFVAGEHLYVEVKGPATARVLHLDVRLGTPARDEATRRTRARAARHPRSTGERTFRVHPDATPC